MPSAFLCLALTASLTGPGWTHDDRPMTRVVARPSAGLEPAQAALVIRGDNLTLDFRGQTWEGTPLDASPDERAGLGVSVQGRNITIRNLRVRGYKVGLMAVDSPGLKIEDSDFSDNWKARLKSGREREDVGDWMSYHQNDRDEWLRYGAGVYLRNCDEARIERVTIERGMNGLMITETDRAVIADNSFRFLSSVGLGMYRSSHNLIQQNRIDWCVRGYSHGIYNRGQDSTGILIYEQSNRNVFAYNSVTHGGDGFFLWAGQTTMDTGAGGCNDNLLIGNDFSHAPTNGIEATFSRNAFVHNLVMECWHGIWGGYSFDSLVLDNVFAHNADAIAWEHGQNNLVEGNTFRNDTRAVDLWANATEPADWGYAQRRDTRSRNIVFRDNHFSGTQSSAIRLRRTSSVRFEDNVFSSPRAEVFEIGEGAEAPTGGGNELRVPSPPAEGRLPMGIFSAVRTDPRFTPPTGTMLPSGNVIQGLDRDHNAYMRRFDQGWSPRPSADLQSRVDARMPGLPRIPAWNPAWQDPFLKPGELRGRRFIMIDEWGPVDPTKPALRLRSWDQETGLMQFEVFGPASGSWVILRLSAGLQVVSAESGRGPGVLRLQAIQGVPVGEVRVELAWTGPRFTDSHGRVRRAGEEVPLVFREFHLPIQWTVRQWNYDPASADPRTQEDAWWMAGENAAPRTVANLAFDWQRSPAAGIGPDHFGTLALAEVVAPTGEFEAEVTYDDGVRVIVNGEKLLDEWAYNGPTTKTIRLPVARTWQIRIEHFELAGFSTLKFRIKPAR
ncbi:MAG: right-handed parallel beta-helix repeat-containing protein [Fimbriimonadaceae bacterium]|nr:right-handed parallel beta-helix repeat-containing protein [Fimbriimonadaceae bacterium]